MNYTYTSTNRLLEPHSYMYSSFGGEEFLQGYLADRVERLFSITESPPKMSCPLEIRAHSVIYMLLSDRKQVFPPTSLANLLCKSDSTFVYSDQAISQPTLPDTDTLVDTNNLLDSLLKRLVYGSFDGQTCTETLFWVDRLAQRFEVRKKLFRRYLPGFRKGDGEENDVNLYKKLALLLSLVYSVKSRLNHLSTLLKVNDLMLSLPANTHKEYKTECSLVLSVAVEIHAVLSCAQNQNLDLNF